MAIASPAVAQQFQTPTLPGEQRSVSVSPELVSPELQARIDYANALKAQMLRAQAEQGARDEFAQKAYEAQRAYQAERAYDEYTAYMKMQQQNELMAAIDASVASPAAPHPVGYEQPIQRIPKPRAENRVVTAPRTPAPQNSYAPPVHVTPTPSPSFASFGDEPKPAQSAPFQATPIQAQPKAQSPTQNQTHQQVSYREPQQPPQTAPQRMGAGQVQAQTQSFGSSRPMPPRQITAQPTRRYAQHNAAATNAPATNDGLDYSQRGFIIQENKPYEGLQDRFLSMISGRNRTNTPGRQPRLAQKPRSQNAIVNNQRKQAGRPDRSVATKSVRQLGASHSTNMLSGQGRRSAARYPYQPTSQRKSKPTARPRTDSAASRKQSRVQRAIEFQPRREHGRPVAPVQRVGMVQPVQDPFNDQSIAIPPTMNSPRLQAPRVLQQPTPHAQTEEAIRLAPPEDNLSTQQISVLSDGSQEAETVQQNQFAPPANLEIAPPPTQDFQSPATNNANVEELPFGNQTPQDRQQAVDEVNRRMQELEFGNDDETSRVDEMIERLGNDLRSNPPGEESNRGNAGNNRQDEPGQLEGRTVDANSKTCDEFRQELLDNSIRDIAMDISPLASRNRDPGMAVSRSWTDRQGNVVATGKMIDLRRGYVIIDGENGKQRIAYARLSEADWAAIARYWQIPELCGVGLHGDASRNWTPQTYTWKASALCHKTLFFENRQLERYGHTHGPVAQPIRSVAHFFVSLITVPYQSGIHPATECNYALGFYRPGNCAPWLKDPIPFSLNGTVRQAAVVTALGVIP